MSDLVNDDPRDQFGNTHNWNRSYTHQWGVHGGRAYSEWNCLACDARFTHYYHNVPNIRDAMRTYDVPDKCPGVTK